MEMVFDALADPTRRALLDRLRESGPLSVSELAMRMPITRQAVTKHLDRLHQAGLIRIRRNGRERLHEVDPMPLQAVDDWLEPYARAWDDRLAALQRHLDQDDQRNPAKEDHR
jgi:DNA-binding transcriptional ArsR family regulator